MISALGMHTGDTGAMAAQVAMHTTISAAMGGRRPDSIHAPLGHLQGSASAIGFIGALVYQASMFLQKMKVDDRVDASPVHGFCGGWGLLAADLFDWGERLEPPPCLVWIQLQAR